VLLGEAALQRAVVALSQIGDTKVGA